MHTKNPHIKFLIQEYLAITKLMISPTPKQDKHLIFYVIIKKSHPYFHSKAKHRILVINHTAGIKIIQNHKV